MLDHITFDVADYDRAIDFHDQALALLDPEDRNIEAVCHAAG